MGRIIAFDYGLKRTGVAVTDPMKMIATGLQTVATEELMAFIIKYFKEEVVESIVLGDPINLDSSPAEIAQQVDEFELSLNTQFPDIPIHRIDERFTSKLAFQSIIDSGIPMKKRRNKELVDETSAVIILQNYMERLNI